jgi:hypothetical protein
MHANIFLGDASKQDFTKEENWVEKISKLEKSTSLNKAQHKQKLLCGKLFGFGWNVNVVEDLL